MKTNMLGIHGLINKQKMNQQLLIKRQNVENDGDSQFDRVQLLVDKNINDPYVNGNNNNT